MLRLFFILLLWFVLPAIATAQLAPDTAGMHYVRWKPVKPEDVLWKKSVWRVIDVADWRNAPLRNTPLSAGFPDILLSGIRNGDLTAYADKELTKPLTGMELDSAIVCRGESPCSYPWQITHYGIKEDWIFDREAGQMVVHIRGLAPLARVGEKYKPLFWLAYPDCRAYLSKYTIESTEPKKSRITWDEYFESRAFRAEITKIETLDMPGVKRTTDAADEDEVVGELPRPPFIWPED